MTGSAAGSGPTTTDGTEPVGSIAEEAFKLFRAVAAGPAHEATDRGPGDDASADEHVCSTSWCPVCQVVGFVRDNPEALASVTRSAAAFGRSVRDLLDTALSPQEER